MFKIHLRDTPTQNQQDALCELMENYNNYGIPEDKHTLNSILSIAKAWDFSLDDCKYFLHAANDDLNEAYNSANAEIKDVAYLSLLQEYKSHYNNFVANKLLWKIGEADNFPVSLNRYLYRIAKYDQFDYYDDIDAYAITEDVKTLDDLNNEFKLARLYA